MLRQCALLLAAVALIAVAAAPAQAATAPWQDVLTLDCAGSLRLLPSHPLLHTALNASLARTFVQYASDVLTSRAKCHCEMSAEEASRSFTGDFGALLAAVESKADTGASTRARCGLKYSVDQIGQYIGDFALPATCKSTDYNNGQACTMQLPVPNFPATMQLAVQKCPNAPVGSMPSVSLSCSGTLCTDLFVPCRVDSDCVSGSAGSCAALTPTTAAQINTAISSMLDSTGFMPLAEQDGSCAEFTSANVGLKVFQRLTAFVAQRTTSKAVPATALAGMTFCGVGRFQPVVLKALAQRLPIVELIPGFGEGGLIDGAIGSLLDMLPWESPVSENEFCYWDWYYYVYRCWSYGDAVSGLGKLVAQVTYPFSFFEPMWAATKALFVAEEHLGAPSTLKPVPSLASWDGALDDGTNVKDEARLSGARFMTLTSTLPTPPMAASGSGVVQLLSSSCNGTVNVMPGQPLGIGFVAPALHELLAEGMGIVRSLQECRISKQAAPNNAISQTQLLTRFHPASPLFWSNLYGGPLSAPANGFSPSPAESVLSSVSSKVPPKDTLVNRMSMPFTCNWAQLAELGQCSLEYSGLNSLFTGSRDLTIRLNMQLCNDAPAALPSFSVQCVGADCASFLDLGAQISSCQADGDCGVGRHCQHLESDLLGNFIGSAWWGATADDSCDSGVRNLQTAFNLFKKATGQAAVEFPPSDLTMGICSLRAQDALVADLAPWSAEAVTTLDTAISMKGMAAYKAALVNNTNAAIVPTPTPTPTPDPTPTPTPAPGTSTIVYAPATISLTLQYNQASAPASLEADIKAGILAATGFPSQAGQSVEVTRTFVTVNNVEVLALRIVLTPASNSDASAAAVSTGVSAQLACADQACADAAAAKAGFQSSAQLRAVAAVAVPGSVQSDDGSSEWSSAVGAASPFSLLAALLIAVCAALKL